MFRKLSRLSAAGLITALIGCAVAKSSLEREIQNTTKGIVQVLEQPAGFAVDVMTLEVVNQFWDEITIFQDYRKKIEKIKEKSIERIIQEELLKKIGKVKNNKVVEIDYNSNPASALARSERIIFEEITKAGISSRGSAILLLPGLIKSKLDCDTTSFIHLDILKGLGLPVYESIVYSVAPNHEFVRYDDGKRKFNLETTAGILLEEKKARKYYDSITKDDMVYGRMFVKLTQKESLALKYVNYATYCAYSNKNQAAERWMKKAMKIDPDFAVPYFFVIGLNRRIGKDKEAEKAAKRFAEKFPYYDLPELVLAGLAHVKGDNEGAIQHCDKAIRLGYNPRAYKVATSIAQSAGNHAKAKQYKDAMKKLRVK